MIETIHDTMQSAKLAYRRKIADAYLAGQTLWEIAAWSGLSARTVSRWLDQEGIPKRRRGRPTATEETIPCAEP